MKGSRWMLYGANGYTGRLIAAEAVRRGERPILAGRRADAVEALARQHDLEHRVFGLDGTIDLDGVDAVIHAAGPFSATSAPMVSACLERGVHYLDITGEISVFEACQARGDEARERGVALMPGVGFDVVPSDCLAAMLARALPGADLLELAIKFAGPSSGGTARSTIEGAAQGGAIRENGQIKRVPMAHKTMEVPFRDRRRSAVSIPWGDVSTAYVSTKIPNITVYMAMPRTEIFGIKVMRPFLGLLRNPRLRALAARMVPASGDGPSEEHRRTARSHLWGRVTHASGRSVSGTLETPEGYELTSRTSVESVRRLLNDGQKRSGFLTPEYRLWPRLHYPFRYLYICS